MKGIRREGTQSECVIRKLLRLLGIAYRVRNADLPGSPDMANRNRKWAIFVHGCFWHSHQNCLRATLPKRNRSFWLMKFVQNRKRDARVLRSLRRQGFRVAVIWECQIEDDLERVENRLRRFFEIRHPQTCRNRDA